MIQRGGAFELNQRGAAAGMGRSNIRESALPPGAWAAGGPQYRACGGRAMHNFVRYTAHVCANLHKLFTKKLYKTPYNTVH